MIIYKVTNKSTGKVYIGQTIVSLDRRKYIHNSKGTKTYISSAIRKHGKDNFDWEIIEKCNSKNELDEMEFHYIKQYHSHVSEYGYNLTYGGDGACSGNLNVAKRPEVRKKLRMHRKYFNPMDDDNVKNKVKKTLTGRKLTDKHKHNISKGMLGGTRPKGKDSKLSKQFTVEYPDGIINDIKGIRCFCRTNILNPKLLRKTLLTNKKHKGFRILCVK